MTDAKSPPWDEFKTFVMFSDDLMKKCEANENLTDEQCINEILAVVGSKTNPHAVQLLVSVIGYFISNVDNDDAIVALAENCRMHILMCAQNNKRLIDAAKRAH